jgi:hypothetical protein
MLLAHLVFTRYTRLSAMGKMTLLAAFNRLVISLAH